LPATSEQLAESDVDQRWQELTKQHKDSGETGLRGGQPWDTISNEHFFQVPNGLGFIKNKKQLLSFPLSPPIKPTGSLRESENRDISI